MEDCEAKLQRADKLIGGLGGEKVRWQDTVGALSRAMINVVGDVVVAAGAIAYSGPFTPQYRFAPPLAAACGPIRAVHVFHQHQVNSAVFSHKSWQTWLNLRSP